MSERRKLSGMAALIAAGNTPLRKGADEMDTEYVKRIVNAYLDAEDVLSAEERRIAAADLVIARRLRPSQQEGNQG